MSTNQHPYVGLAGTFYKKHGIIVAIGQGGSTNEEGCAYTSAIVLNDDDTTNEGDLAYFVPDDPAEARRRLTAPAREWSGPARYQTWIDDCAARPDDHPDNLPPGFVAIGPWEPGNIAPGSVQGADYEWRPVMMQAWSRPLRRVQP